MIRKAAFFALALTAGFAQAAPIPAELAFSKDANIAYSYQLPAKSTDSVFVGFDFSFTGTIQTNDFLGLYFGKAGSMGEAYKGPNFGFKANCGTGANKCTNDVFGRTVGTDGTFVNGSDLKAGTTYKLFGHMYKTGGSEFYNAFDVWLNPTASEMSSLTGADITATGKSTLKSFDTIAFRTANIDNGVTLYVNNLRVNEVPEPGSVALMGLALAGLAAARRKRA